MRQELEQVQLGDHPGRAVCARDQEGRVSARQDGEGGVERGIDVDGRERPVHDLADGPLDGLRVPIRSVEKALLADRADDTVECIALGLLRDRELADAEALERVDRIADTIRGPRQNEVRKDSPG